MQEDAGTGALHARQGAHREAGGGEAQVEDKVQDLVVQRAVQADQADACSGTPVSWCQDMPRQETWQQCRGVPVW